MKKIILLLLLTLPLVLFSQLTINVTPTNEFCTGDGKAQIDLGGTSVGANFDFNIYKLPNTTTPYRTVTSIVAAGSSFSYTETSLPSGSYNIIATENVSGVIRNVSGNFSISNNFVPVNFTLSTSESCIGKSIIANVTAGNPVTYELRDNLNNVIMPPQTSNIITPTAARNYRVVVTDVCGNTTSLGIVHTMATAAYNVERSSEQNNNTGFVMMQDCNTIEHREVLQYNGSTTIPSYRFPISRNIVVQNPLGGSNTVINSVMNSGADNNAIISVPYYAGYNYNYTITYTDACGLVFTKTDVINGTPAMSIEQRSGNCFGKFLRFYNFRNHFAPIEVKFTSYPAGFDPSSYNSNYTAGAYTYTFSTLPTEIYYGSATNTLPVGSYTVQITSCGRTQTYTFTITNSSAFELRTNTYAGCGDNESSLFIDINSSTDKLASVVITAAPADFIATFGSLPYNASANITNYTSSNYGIGVFLMNSLPPGSYTFQATSTCGAVYNRTVTVVTPIPTTTVVNPVYNCGSFNVTAAATGNIGDINKRLVLQKYYLYLESGDILIILPHCILMVQILIPQMLSK